MQMSVADVFFADVSKVLRYVDLSTYTPVLVMPVLWMVLFLTPRYPLNSMK